MKYSPLYLNQLGDQRSCKWRRVLLKDIRSLVFILEKNGMVDTEDGGDRRGGRDKTGGNGETGSPIINGQV